MSQEAKPTAEGALADLRVLDLSRILAGPYCSMVLADYGAEVIKIERPGIGDGTRQWGPPWVGTESAYFLSVNRNKKSVALDLKQPSGQELARRLARRSDVVIENFKAGTAERLGLGYPRLSKENPGLVYCSITGYGQTGPYRDRPGYDFVIQAQGGIMSVTGASDGEPHKVGVAIVDVSTGLFATTAILAALHSRQTSGKGQHIDVALLDAQVAWLANVAQNYLVTGEPPQRHGNAHPNIVPYESFPTADSQIALAIGSNEQYERFCQAVGQPDLWTDARFRTNHGRVTHRRVLVAKLQRLFSQKPTADWLELLWAAALPASAINDLPALFADPQVRARAMVQSVDHATQGKIEVVGPVAKFSATPASVRTAPPILGADTRTVLREILECTQEELEEFERQGVTQFADRPPSRKPQG